MHNNVKNTTQRETTHMKEQAQYVLSKDELLTNVPRSWNSHFFVHLLSENLQWEHSDSINLHVRLKSLQVNNISDQTMLNNWNEQ